MSNARNISTLSTVEVGATADQTKADLNAIGVSGGRKNLIINGRLGTNTMVNQRGFASGTLSDGVYGFDRWVSASGSSVLALNADDVTLTSGKLLQFIEDPHISGKQITVSAKVNSGTLTGRVGTGAIAFQTLPFTITAPSGNLRLELVGNGAQFTDVQVELGYVATDFEHRSYGEELALCQRYLEVFTSSGVAYHSMSQGSCHSSQGNALIQFATTKRSNTYSITYSGINYSDTVAMTSTAGINSSTKQKGSALVVDTSQSFVSGRPYILYGTSSSATITIEDEL